MRSLQKNSINCCWFSPWKCGEVVLSEVAVLMVKIPSLNQWFLKIWGVFLQDKISASILRADNFPIPSKLQEKWLPLLSAVSCKKNRCVIIFAPQALRPYFWRVCLRYFCDYLILYTYVSHYRNMFFFRDDLKVVFACTGYDMMRYLDVELFCTN